MSHAIDMDKWCSSIPVHGVYPSPDLDGSEWILPGIAIRLGADAGVLRTLVSTPRIAEGGLMSEHMGKPIGRSNTLALGVCQP